MKQTRGGAVERPWNDDIEDPMNLGFVIGGTALILIGQVMQAYKAEHGVDGVVDMESANLRVRFFMDDEQPMVRVTGTMDIEEDKG